MQSAANLTERFNQFLYRQHIRKLGPSDIDLAKDWCLTLIRREYPQLSPEEVDRFYDNLIQVKWTAVDEWSRRMS